MRGYIRGYVPEYMSGYVRGRFIREYLIIPSSPSAVSSPPSRSERSKGGAGGRVPSEPDPCPSGGGEGM